MSNHIDEISDRVCAALVAADAGRMGLERDEHLGIPDPYDKEDGYSSTASVTIREVVAVLLDDEDALLKQDQEMKDMLNTNTLTLREITVSDIRTGQTILRVAIRDGKVETQAIKVGYTYSDTMTLNERVRFYLIEGLADLT